MKVQHIVLVVALITSCGAANSQTAGFITGDIDKPKTTKPLSAEAYRFEIIKHIMGSPIPIGSVQLHRMGDRAAVYVSKILESRPPLTAAEQQTVVDMIHRAYERPATITEEGRQTTATLALLQQLDASTQDFNQRLRIADARQFVFAAALRFAAK